LNEPISDDFFIESLPIFLETLQISGELSACMSNELHSQYSMIMMSSCSMRKNSLYETTKGISLELISLLSFSRISIWVSKRYFSEGGLDFLFGKTLQEHLLGYVIFRFFALFAVVEFNFVDLAWVKRGVP
jgi:hypothetical protein